MITEKDDRIIRPTSKYQDNLTNAVNIALDYIVQNKKSFEERDYGMDRIQVSPVMRKFDELICKNGGFEIDGRTLRHAHGIGNNNEWDIVDKELVKVGDFYCNDDMFGGVYVGVEVDGDVIRKHHLR